VTDKEVLYSAKSKKPRFFYGYVIVVAAFFIMMITAGTLNCYGVFFKSLATEFDWPRSLTSGAYSLSMLLYGSLGIIAGRLNDRFGPRLLATICGSLYGSGFFLMSQISNVWQLYLFFGVMIAMGRSGIWVPMMSVVAKWFVKRRGLMTGIAVAGTGVGILVMPPMATQLIAVYGWRTAFVILGITALVVNVVAAQFLRRDPSQIAQLPDGEKGIKLKDGLVSEVKEHSLKEATSTRQFWMLCVIWLSFMVSVTGIIVHLVPHITDLGISAVSAASVYAIAGGVSIAGRIGMGNVGDRIGNKLAFAIVFISMIVAFLWLRSAEELWMFYLFAVLFGFGWGGGAALHSPMVAALFGLRSHGAILGIVVFVGAIGGAVGPVLAGRLFDIAGSYQVAFLVFAVVAIIGLVLTVLLRLPRRLS